MRRGIYIASKAIHGARWRALRAEGVPIVSTWIDESEPGQTADWGDLWMRAIEEAGDSAAIVVYNESGERMKGALAEIGSALRAGAPAFWSGPSDDPEGKEYTIVRHRLVTRCPSLEHAWLLALAAAGVDGLTSQILKAHPPTNECPIPECDLCGERDCPHGEAGHYWHDGCPACSFDDGVDEECE
jgi:hypothetical protein